MAHDTESFGIFLGEDPQADFRVVRQRVVETYHLAVDFRRDGVAGQTRADPLGHVARSGRGREF